MSAKPNKYAIRGNWAQIELNRFDFVSPDQSKGGLSPNRNHTVGTKWEGPGAPPANAQRVLWRDTDGSKLDEGFVVFEPNPWERHAQL